jgi:hypothetical protein
LLFVASMTKEKMAVLALSLGLVACDLEAPEEELASATAAARFSGGQFALEIGGINAGWVYSVEGGETGADVVLEIDASSLGPVLEWVQAGDLRDVVLHGETEDIVLGRVSPGSTGFSYGAHLHLELSVGDSVRNVPRTGPPPRPPAPWTVDGIVLSVDGVDFAPLSASFKKHGFTFAVSQADYRGFATLPSTRMHMVVHTSGGGARQQLMIRPDGPLSGRRATHAPDRVKVQFYVEQFTFDRWQED